MAAPASADAKPFLHPAFVEKMVRTFDGTMWEQTFEQPLAEVRQCCRIPPEGVLG